MGSHFTENHGNRARTFRDLVIISVIAVLAFAIAYFFILLEMIADLSREHVGWNIDEFIIVLAILAFAFWIFSLWRWRDLNDPIKMFTKVNKKVGEFCYQFHRFSIRMTLNG